MTRPTSCLVAREEEARAARRCVLRRAGPLRLQFAMLQCRSCREEEPLSCGVGLFRRAFNKRCVEGVLQTGERASVGGARVSRSCACVPWVVAFRFCCFLLVDHEVLSHAPR